MNYTFDSQFKIIGSFSMQFKEESVKNEPMLFNCDFKHAWGMGGRITKAFLTSIPDDWTENVVIDSRVHMLMPGWFPAIPGYHHDDIPRNTVNGQPDYDTTSYQSEHLMGLVNGEICPTVYAVGTHELPKLGQDAIIYKEWHEIVEDQIEKGILKAKEAPSGKIIYFNNHSMHTAQRAKKGGWRWFIRISRNTDRVKDVTNELRRQVQVYLGDSLYNGW